MITPQKPRWEIRFKARNIRHVADGTTMAREIEADDKASAMIMFKMASPDCDVIEVVEVFGNRFGSDNPNTDLAKTKKLT
jgi:hypothetical protein